MRREAQGRLFSKVDGRRIFSSELERTQVKHPASNPGWCSDVFLLSCWSGEVVSAAFAIDGHGREVPAWTASPRSLTGADVRTVLDRALRACLARRSSEPRTPCSGSVTMPRS